MKRTLQRELSAIILIFSFADIVAAGPLEDADAAVKKRDYATAARIIRPLAEQATQEPSTRSGSFTTTALACRRTVSPPICGLTCRRPKAK
jgi:hypothetical protein